MRRALSTLLLLFAFLQIIAGTASARVDPGLKNRVWDFSENPNIDTYGEWPLAHVEQGENTTAIYDPATGVVFYVNQNPWSKFDPKGLAGYFFDGTGNDKKDTEEKGTAPTNVEGLSKAYGGKAYYENGVGTRTDKFLGGISGKGARERLDSMFKKFESAYKSGDKDIDIFGFSRGAAMAREFSNMIADKYPDAEVRFLGLFDTVAQIGLPDNMNINPGIRLDIPSNVKFVAHAVAKNEHRVLFPLTSVVDQYRKQSHGEFGRYGPSDLKEFKGSNFWEKPFSGAHSDIGGGYKDGRNTQALGWMYSVGISKGVPLDFNNVRAKDRIPYGTTPPKWHNSRMSGSGVPDFFRPFFGILRKDRAAFSGNLKP